MSKKDTYAVITGASSGIGLEFAKRLSIEGYNLILVARRREKLEKLSKKLQEYGNRVEIFVADISREEECYNLISEIEDKRIAVFINNAGFGDCGIFTETDLAKDLQMIDVNVRALHLLTKLVLKKFKKQNFGYLLNVASSAGFIPAGPYMATYYATKAYVTSLTRAVARELKEQKSKVYIGCLCPGPVDTEFNDVANVQFALKGISPSYCANYAIDKMKKRKVVIVPSLKMKMAMFGGRVIPDDLYIKIAGHQQKKKFM